MYGGGEVAIDATYPRATGPSRNTRLTRCAAYAVALAVVTALILIGFASAAFAGRAATGEPAFHPCTRCHPVTVGSDGKPSRPLPNGFKKHEIELEVHDTLGAGDKACIACHDDPTRNPGNLLLPDGSLVDIEGDVSRVCQRCHFEKYREWESGIHGKRAAKCTSAGCHDPHTPSWIYIPALPPFQGTGMEVRAVSERETFKPLAPPPLAPEVETPMWLMILTGVGGLACLGFLGITIMGRPKR